MDKLDELKKALLELDDDELRALIFECSPTGEFEDIVVYHMSDLDELTDTMSHTELLRTIADNFDINAEFFAFTDNDELVSYTSGEWREEIGDRIGDLADAVLERASSSGAFYSDLPDNIQEIINDGDEDDDR